jgi:predicted unusual protein kinase regulating ubiquinone biosynthesis (AarF/ABC1/UbiB family)
MSGSNFLGELRRMARTSGAVGGIAARMAGERMFGIRTDRAAHAEDLRTILGGLKGPLMKVAQFLSTVPDALPVEYAEELAQLQANAPAMGWNFVRRRMASELGPEWRSRFEAFSQTASAAASLGQVHRATLPDGREVACNIRTCRVLSRPICVSCAWPWPCITAWTMRFNTRRSTKN